MEIKRSRSKTMVSLAVLFALALVVAGGTLGYFWYRKAHEPQQAQPTPGGTVNINTAKKVETETLQSALVIPKSTDKPGDTIGVSVLTMTTPKSWRTVNGRTIINTPLETVYAESLNDILAQFIMVPESDPTDPTLAVNGLSFYNITAWLKKPSTGNAGQVTPAMKSAYIANIANIAEGKPTDKTACNKGAGVLNVSICGELLKPTPLTTSDGRLKGVAFLNTAAQSVSYDPQVYVFLTGKLKDQQVLAYGNFHLLDQASHQIDVKDTDGVKAAWDAFVKGNIPEDTTQLYQHVIDAIRSISIKVN